MASTATNNKTTPAMHAVTEEVCLVNTKQARRVLSRVNLLEESNSLAMDIGGNLAKLLYLAPDGTPPPAMRGNPGLSVHVGELGGTLHFWAFETRHVGELVDFVRDHWDVSEQGTRVIRATGGGSYKYSDMFRTKIDVDLSRIDELKCSVAGLNFLLHYVDNEVFVFERSGGVPSTQNRDSCAAVAGKRVFISKHNSPFPYLLVNLGTGVSIVKVTGHGQFERISGSALGGGTFWGLARLLLNCKTFDDVIELTNNGTHSNVDMLVGDIYGGAYKNFELDEDVIAASFGKVTMLPNTTVHGQHFSSLYNTTLLKTVLRAIQNTWNLWLAVVLALPIIGTVLRACGVQDPFRGNIANIALASRFRPEDVAISLLRMVAYNIGQIAYLNAKLHGLERIYFGGNFVRNHPHTIADVSFAVDFWSQGKSKAHFLKHDGYLGAIGAFIGGASESPTKHVAKNNKKNNNTSNNNGKKKNNKPSCALDASSTITEDSNGNNENCDAQKENGNGNDAKSAQAKERNGESAPADGNTSIATSGTTTTTGTTKAKKKSRSRKGRAKGTTGAPNGEANGVGHGDTHGNNNNNNTNEANGNGVVYYDDPHDEAVQEVLAGEWSVINRRGKKDRKNKNNISNNNIDEAPEENVAQVAA